MLQRKQLNMIELNESEDVRAGYFEVLMQGGTCNTIEMCEISKKNF